MAVILHLIAQICLKGGMEYIYEMYFALQIVAYLSYYNFDKPPNALKFSEALIKIVEFQTLSPEPFIQLWDKDFTIEGYISRKTKSGQWFSENYIFLVILILFVIFIILLVLLLITGYKREKVRNTLQEQLNNWIFKKLIISYKLAFFKQVITAIKNNNTTILYVLLALDLISILVLQGYKRETLKTSMVKSYINEMYDGVDLDGGWVPLMFFPVW